MTSTYSQTFSAPPSLWALYPRILAARKPGLVPEGVRVPRLEARLSRLRVDPAHVARYREICGCAAGEELPIAYPHVLASALHLSILASDRFPVGLLGLVHLANRIEQRGRLDAARGGELRCWLEGHEEGLRGQLFAMHTEWRAGGDLLWCERSDFLARAPRGSRPSGATAGSTAEASASRREPAGDDREAGLEGPASTASFRADAGLGRRYGQISGDMNPIHVADVTARAFGFRAAIAHGMWSLARCAAEVAALLPADEPRCLDVRFLKPVFLPSWVQLRTVRDAAGARFALLDSQGETLHLAGSLTRAA